jgi:hypothetical protein
VSKARLRSELNLKNDELPTDVALTGEAKTVNEIVYERLGRPHLTEDPTKSDVAILGAHIVHAERPVPLVTLVRILGWEVDRVIEAQEQLARELPSLGQALFVYADESVQIGPIATMLKEGETFRSIEAARHAIALQGVTAKEATLLRNLREGAISLAGASSGASHALIRRLVKTGLARVRGDSVKIAKEIDAIYVSQSSFGLGKPIE